MLPSIDSQEIRLSLFRYLHDSVLVWPVNGEILHFGFVTWDRVGLVVFAGVLLPVFASESWITEDVCRVVRVQKTSDTQFVVRLRKSAEGNVTILFAELAGFVLGTIPSKIDEKSFDSLSLKESHFSARI